MQSDSKKRLVKRGAVRNAKLSESGMNLPLPLSLSSVKEEVPKDEVSSLEWDASADYVTLVRLGVNCPKCGISTDIGDPSCMMSEVRVNRESEERKTEEEIKGRVKKNSAWCSSCKDYALTCSLCQMAIRGAGYFCTFCGHGGHTDHMREWFEQTVECASGCGCRCGELAMLGHSAGITKTKYALEWEEGSDNWGGTGSKTQSASESLAGSTRHSLEKEAAVHERQGSGSDYFLYNSGDSSESDDQSSHSSSGGGAGEGGGGGDDGFESEYTSDTASVSEDDGLQGAGRGMGSQTGAKDGFQGGHHRFREKERDSRHDGSASKTDFDESSYSAFGQNFDN